MTATLPTATEPTPARSPATGRLEAVDVLRGLACLWVLFHHGQLYTGFRLRGPVVWHLTDVFRVGYLGVHLFLVLSGFVLFYPVVRRHGVRRARVPVGTFFYRRCRRILPPYYAALALCVVAVAVWPTARGLMGSANGPKDYLLHLTMAFNLDPTTITDFNGSFWSLALEFQLYLTFPLLLLLARIGGMATVVGVTLAVSLLWQCVVVPRVLPAVPPMDGRLVWPYLAARWYALPGRWSEFAMGMAAAAAVADRPRWWKVATAAAVLAVVTPFAVRLVLPLNGQFGPARDPLWGAAFASLLVLSSAAPARLVDSLPARAVAWLGGISYSVYLLHQPLIQLSRPMLDHFHVPDGQRFGWFLFVGLPVLIAAGYAFHRVAERPFLSISQKKLADLAAQPVA